jgi:putative PIN family toxin of toxin-antitoxin system
MIRVVLDTNIIVSALLQPLGPSAQIFLLALGGSIQLCVSGAIYAEYEEVISRPRFQRTEAVVTGTLKAIREKGLWVRPTEEVRACPDPDDDIFLECAQAAQAAYLVTGNIKHFPTSWAGTKVVTPRWCLDHLLARKSEEAAER